ERYVPGDRYCETRWSIRTLLASLILVRASGPYLVFKVRINAGSMSLAKASQPSRCAVSLVDRRSSKNWWTKCLMYRFLARPSDNLDSFVRQIPVTWRLLALEEKMVLCLLMLRAPSKACINSWLTVPGRSNSTWRLDVENVRSSAYRE